MRNTFIIFRKNKEFIYLIVIQPVLIFLLMSFLLPYTTTHNVAVSNAGSSAASVLITENLGKLEGISVTEISEDKITERLIGGNVELAVLITDTPDSDIPAVDIINVGHSEIEKAVELSIAATLNTLKNGNVDTVPVTVNEAPKKWLSVSNSLAFMIFKTLTSANLLAALIIQERNKRMKDRILLSGIKKPSYITGMSLVYLAFMMIGSVIYFLVGLVLNFDFGMRNPLGFLLMLFVSNILSVSIYVCFAAFVKKEDSLSFVGTFILMPMSLFAGVLFPFRFMPEAMRNIGSCFPQRWIAGGIEKIQTSGSITGAWPEILMTLGLSAILFVIGIVCERSHNKKTRRRKTNE